MTIALSPDRQLEVCSRNISLKLSVIDNTFIKTAMETGIFNHIGNLVHESIAIQGELMGEGIQGNLENIKGHEFYIFDIYFPLKNRYATPEERWQILNYFSLVCNVELLHVPVLYESVTLKELGLHTIEHVLQFASGESLNAEQREGVVFKSIDGTFSFKAISNSWLLKNE